MRPYPNSLAPELVVELKHLRYDCGLNCAETGRRMDLDPRLVGKYAPGRRDYINNKPLREAFERSVMTAAEVAKVLGWRDTKNCWDGQRVRRTLGLAKESTGKRGNRHYRQQIHKTHALKLAEAIGVDPWEVGL